MEQVSSAAMTRDTDADLFDDDLDAVAIALEQAAPGRACPKMCPPAAAG